MIIKEWNSNDIFCLDLSSSTQYKKKKQIIDLIISRGARVSFILNNISDLISKCYVEITIPTLSFSESSTVTQLKKNELQNIQKNMNKWKSLYDNLKSYCSIEILLYQNLNNLLQSINITNQILTSANSALYGILCSAVHSMGYSPHIGFIHSGSPLPFVYDLADLYKEHLCIDLAFAMTLDMAGVYNKHKMSNAFRKRVIDMDLLGKIGTDIEAILGGKKK
jgi:hypothetical protein